MNNGWKLAQGVSEDVLLCSAYIEQYLRLEDAPAPVEQILSLVTENQGKRMRPALLLLSGRFGEGYSSNRARLCTAAALVEMVHAASLIHDDIVDDSPLRRGSPTVQAQFGKDMAVYAGDLLLSRMMHRMLQAGLYETGRILCSAISRMCYGEICQRGAMFNPDATEANYYAAIEGKTAVLFEASCRCGALEGGCGDELTGILAQFGHVFGVLFQLRDDLLDFSSDAVAQGKPVHQDFLHGIFTLPVLFALRHPHTREEMRRAVSLIKTSPQEASRLMERAVESSGGMEYARQQARSHHDQALRLLRLCPESDAREGLGQALSLLQMV